jgi:hypothetical protein
MVNDKIANGAGAERLFESVAIGDAALTDRGAARTSLAGAEA